MSATCPAGHASEATDYCDVCGMPIGPAGAPPPEAAAPEAAAPQAPAAGGGSEAPAAGGGPQVCPNCSAENPKDALFCEACGYDFTTGTLPRPTETPAAVGESPVPSSGGSLDLDAPDTPVTATGLGSSARATPAAPAAPTPVPAPVEWVAEVWVDPDWYDVQSSDEPMPSAGLPVVVPLRGKSVLVGRPSASRHITPDVDCSADTGVSRRQAQLTTDGSRWFVEDLQSSNGTWVGPASGPLPSEPIQPGQRRELAEDDRVYVGAWTRLVVRRALPDEQF